MCVRVCVCLYVATLGDKTVKKQENEFIVFSFLDLLSYYGRLMTNIILLKVFILLT